MTQIRLTSLCLSTLETVSWAEDWQSENRNENHSDVGWLLF